MLRVGLTGGIGAGKSTVSWRLAKLGAVVLDADAIARQVVEPGTPGLAAVVEAFGVGVLNVDGALNRPALAARVFGDDSARRTLNGVVHPLIGARTAELAAAAPADAVLVHDSPLLVENHLGAAFHLVVVVHTPADERVRRLTSSRGMAEPDAWARVRVQATDDERRAAADVWLDNSGVSGSLEPAVDTLWHTRLRPYERDVRAGTWSRHRPVLVAADPTWPAQAERIAARLRLVLGEVALRVDHIGSTSVSGLAAKDVLDLQVTVRSLEAVDAMAEALGEAGFSRHDYRHDRPKVQHPDPADWGQRLHLHADPGRAANVHLRVVGSRGQRFALIFRDWLRAEPAVAAEYLAVKHAAQAGALALTDYAEAKEPWFDAAYPRALAWAESTGWPPPQASAPPAPTR